MPLYKRIAAQIIGPTVYNDASADVDFRMEGDTDPNLFYLDASTDRIGLGTATPAQRLDVVGNFQIADNATPAKEYRFRTSGTSLDVDFAGAALLISGFDNPGYGGTQRNKLVLKINEDTSQLVGDWEVAAAPFATGHHWFGGRAGGQVRINDDQQATNTIIKAQTTVNMLFVDAGANRVGIATGVPSETFDVLGNFQVKDADTSTKSYRFRTNGGNLDVDFSGKDGFISVYSAANYGGTQRNKLRLEAGADIIDIVRKVNFVDAPFSGAHHVIDGTTGGLATFNTDNTAAGDLNIKGQTDNNLLYADVSADSVGIGTATPAKKLTVSGDVSLMTAGNGLYVKEGTNATMGVVTLVAGTATVATTKVTANSRIFLTAQSLGTVTIGQGLAVSARTGGTSFTILSQSALDTSVVSWHIIEPS